MKSTEMILDITEQFGDEQKRELARELKKFRTQVKNEITGRMKRKLESINQEYA